MTDRGDARPPRREELNRRIERWINPESNVILGYTGESLLRECQQLLDDAEARVTALQQEKDAAKNACATLVAELNRACGQRDAHAQTIARLREVLQRMADDASECQCDHTDEDCCVKQVSDDSLCSRCVAAEALRPSLAPPPPEPIP